MYYNKQYGLKLLGEALKGVEGTSVLPYRVYRSPAEYNWRHFFGASRVLLRSNLDGNLEKTVWMHLPRMDAHRKVKAKVQQMFDYWNRIKNGHRRFAEPGQLDSFHVIAHRVKLRRSYYFYLALKQTESGIEISINRLTKKSGKNWRQEDFIVEPRNLANEITAYTRLKPQQARQIAERVKAAHEAILHELEARGINPKKAHFEVALSTKKSSPTKLEFYDFLLTPERE